MYVTPHCILVSVLSMAMGFDGTLLAFYVTRTISAAWKQA